MGKFYYSNVYHGDTHREKLEIAKSRGIVK